MTTKERSVLALQAGVEHELTFTSEDFNKQLIGMGREVLDNPDKINLEAREYVARHLIKEGINVDDAIAETKIRAADVVYKEKWTLPKEEGLTENPNEYSLELASPIADVASKEWISQTIDIYQSFEPGSGINIEAPPDTCATHVHISPKDVP
ncbi:hypothetical protein BU23DRAFT_572056 [Bimuria novae-zelandiae CBS 107.79]|uniref:Uncharacterized protein n=1 Tax=Bimuria novae-zelandiae CBS 107.79 TaxID=1447943 RepID=A0A6A5V174_9PLEO|nr:hypothetical protein BU23DRAFT_572056 [Bimuria novae-zelandiae CBS 107.79]